MVTRLHPGTDNRARSSLHTTVTSNNAWPYGRWQCFDSGLSVGTRTVSDMTGVGVRWSAEQVLALAPDAASSRAGSKLVDPAPWSATGAGRGAVWGECKGGGCTPYRTAVDVEGADGPAFTCSCPSRKSPCKHALGLLLRRARAAEESGPAAEEGTEPPEWVSTWLDSRRDGRAPARRPRGHGEPRAGAGTAGRRAEVRTRRRAQRMAAGATELEQRLADFLRGGLAGADRAGFAPWEEMSARMVDAQAPGLASRVRELGGVPSSGVDWPERLLSECSLLHLLDRALLGLDSLPEPMASTVRARVGLTVEAAGLLADESARVTDDWLVVARHDTEEGRLTARRSWLYGRRTSRPALLLSYGVAGRSPEPALPVGSSFDANLFFYPGAPSLRAVLGERRGTACPFEPAGGTAEEALAAYGAALRDDPWLEALPAVLRGVVPVPDTSTGSIAQLADAEGQALPVAPGSPAHALWRLAAVSGGEPVTVFGTCGHRGFSPYTTWREGRTVQL